MRARLGAALPLADLTEQQFARQVADLARLYQWLRYHTYRSEKSPPGFPDECFVRDRLLFAELKREHGKPSDRQTEWLTALTKASVETYLFWPSDLDDISRVFAAREPIVVGSRWTVNGCRYDQVPNQLTLQPKGHA